MTCFQLKLGSKDDNIYSHWFVLPSYIFVNDFYILFFPYCLFENETLSRIIQWKDIDWKII